MIGMNWLEPITPICTATEASYVLLAVDYFTRFVWAKAYQYHEAFETMDLLREHIAPVFDWPKKVYTDNGPHFVNYDVTCLMKQHEVSHFTGPVSHPESTGLLERMVQELLSMISKKCIERQSTNS